MKIYTRQGDEGMTRLSGGRRESKDSARLEAVGSVDELNAVIGRALAGGVDSRLKEPLTVVQDWLFCLGCELARPQGGGGSPAVDSGSVERLEAWIDRFSRELPELKNFVLPGGTPLGADLHWARTVCRRAERRVQTLVSRESASPVVIPFLNRLGDLLFTLARWANHQAGREETLWEPGFRDDDE